MERPVIMPISTETHSSRTSPSDAYLVKGRLGASLPSPPLSPQQDYGFAKRSSAALSSLPSITVSNADGDDTHGAAASLASSLQDLALLPSSSPLSFTSAHEPEATPPMLPSQLRRRHESLKLQSKQQQQQQPPSSPQPFLFSTSKHYDDDYNSDDDNNDNNDDTRSPHRRLDTPGLSLAPPASSLSPQPTHSLVRAKSYSQFETNRRALGYAPISSYTSTSPSLSSYHAPSTCSMPEMSTRDWVKMQSRINELEMQISHISRANQLLNQELDKVNGHLLRLTSDENGECDEGWRREYEFLVQQVDLMHRQLQMAQNPQYQYQLLMQHQQQQHQQQQLPAPAVDRSEVSRQLHSEVKELTESLRSWQAAFKQAEEKYRRKCDGERALKQTLRERETQLSGLVSKLSSYESDFQKSIANYTTQIDTLLAKNSSSSSSNNNTDTDRTVAENEDKSKNEPEDMHMPGTFPSTTNHIAHEQFSVSILSWAALLATYMLS